MTTFNFRGLPDCFVRMIRFFVVIYGWPLYKAQFEKSLWIPLIWQHRRDIAASHALVKPKAAARHSAVCTIWYWCMLNCSFCWTNITCSVANSALCVLLYSVHYLETGRPLCSSVNCGGSQLIEGGPTSLTTQEGRIVIFFFSSNHEGRLPPIKNIWNQHHVTDGDHRFKMCTLLWSPLLW